MSELHYHYATVLHILFAPPYMKIILLYNNYDYELLIYLRCRGILCILHMALDIVRQIPSNRNYYIIIYYSII